MNRKLLWLFSVLVAALVLCPAAYGAPQASIALFTFCGMEEWAKEAARKPPTSLCIQINECEFGHDPLWVEDRETIEEILSALGEIYVTSALPDYGVATGTDTYYVFAMGDGGEAEIAFQNGMLFVDPHGHDGRLYPVSGMEKLNALTQRIELLYLYTSVRKPGVSSLTLSFPETPSTGYLWSLRIEDPDVLALTEEGFVRGSNNDMPGGDGGNHSYTFAAKKPGRSELVFSLISHHDEVVETRRYIVVADGGLHLTEQEQFPEPEETAEPTKDPDLSGLPDTPLERDRDVIIDGQRVTLVLGENPTTGYLFSVRIGRPEIVTLEGERYTPDDLSEMTDGGGGRHAYTFSAKAKGVTAIYFDLISHDGTISRKVDYLITVDETLRVTEAKLKEAR